MTTTTAGTKSAPSMSKRIILIGLALLGIFIASSLILAVNYWAAVIFFFISLLILIHSVLDEDGARGLWMLVIVYLFVTVLCSSLALVGLSNDPGIPALAQSSATANFFLGSDAALVLTSILIGLLAAIALVVIPFLLLVAVATAGILKWHKKDEQISFFEAFRYLLKSVLGLSGFSVIIDNGEIKGSEKDKTRLANFGGPGKITVYPGQVVVLYRWGKFTRAVGVGPTMLKREELIREIMPLVARGGPNIVENVLTRDRIPLTMTVAHVAQMETAAETKARLQKAVAETQANLAKLRATGTSSSENLQDAEQKVKEATERFKTLENDRIIGDDYLQCYESIAKLAAAKTPNILEGLRIPVVNNLRDVIMSEYFEDLFKISNNDEDLMARVNQRKIAEIEKMVVERARKVKIDEGVVLRLVDIQEVRFPEEIEERIKTEMTALADARIKNIEAQTREQTAEIKNKIMLNDAIARSTAKATEAEGEQTAAEIRSQAIIIRAKSEAEAAVWHGRGRAAAVAENYRQIIQVLKQENQSEATIRAVLQSLAAAYSTVHYIQEEQTIYTPPEPTTGQK
jgi:hypothetical protein